MRNRVHTLTSAFACIVLFTFHSAALFAEDDKSERGASEQASEHRQTEPPNAAVDWARGEGPRTSGEASTRRSRPSPNLTWQGGPIMPTAAVTAIFWGKSWQTSPGDKISGLDDFYSGIGASSFAATSNEYYYQLNGIYTSVTSAISYAGHIADFSAAPASGGQTAPILAEVCKLITSPVANGYYPVYVDTHRGTAGFCAWHSASTCGSTPVQFGFFFNLDGDVGCDPQDKTTGHSQGLAALANVSGHEISETRSDPRLNAWYDSSGAENADKCAWSFGSAAVTFANGSKWKVQGNWSNLAFGSTTRGYSNLNGQKGCIDGGNFQ